MVGRWASPWDKPAEGERMSDKARWEIPLIQMHQAKTFQQSSRRILLVIMVLLIDLNVAGFWFVFL